MKMILISKMKIMLIIISLIIILLIGFIVIVSIQNENEIIDCSIEGNCEDKNICELNIDWQNITYKLTGFEKESINESCCCAGKECFCVLQ